MSYETERWTELSPGQTAFFSSQIGAVNEIAFSAAALQARINTRESMSYTFGPNDDPGSAVMWTDPCEANTTYIASRNSPQKLPASFVRIGEEPRHFNLEGITINSDNYGQYGQLQIVRSEMEEIISQLSMPAIGLQFLSAAVKARPRLAQQSYEAYENNEPVVTGIDSGVMSRLFESINSFHANLVVANGLKERSFTNATYDLAHLLLRHSVQSIIRQQSRGDHGDTAPRNTLLTIPGGEAIGAVLRSDSDITIVRRTGHRLDTVAIATATRPNEGDSEFMLEQYSVQAKRVIFHAMPLESKYYHSTSILQAIPDLELIPTERRQEYPWGISVEGREALEQKLSRHLADQINQRA